MIPIKKLCSLIVNQTVVGSFNTLFQVFLVFGANLKKVRRSKNTCKKNHVFERDTLVRNIAVL